MWNSGMRQLVCFCFSERGRKEIRTTLTKVVGKCKRKGTAGRSVCSSRSMVRSKLVERVRVCGHRGMTVGVSIVPRPHSQTNEKARSRDIAHDRSKMMQTLTKCARHPQFSN